MLDNKNVLSMQRKDYNKNETSNLRMCTVYCISEF